jgi:hypothetical protein
LEGLIVAEERSALGKVADYMKERVIPEAVDLLVQKGAHGSSEIAMALYNGQGFTPYGYATKPLEPIEAEGPQTSYADTLRSASQQHGPQQDRDQGIER